MYQNFSLSVVSGILSLFLIFIVSNNIKKLYDDETRITALTPDPFLLFRNSSFKPNEIYDVYKTKDIPNGAYDLQSTKYSVERCPSSTNTWLKRVAVPSYLLLLLSLILLIIVGSSVATGPTKYLYITYFKERNTTVTIKVIFFNFEIFTGFL